MTMVDIFHDADCTQSASGVLYEGRKYFILVPDVDAELIRAEFRRARLDDFISWSRHNRVAVLRIINRIGFIHILGRTFDVRSEKFFEGESGTRQFQLLLDDLAALSRHLIFDYSAASRIYRTHRNDDSASILERFNYYRHWFFSDSGRISIEQCIQWIIQDPHSRLVKRHQEAFIWDIRQPAEKTMRSLISHGRHAASWSGIRTDGANEFHAAKRSKPIFPLRAAGTRSRVNHDTPENRFIKYLLSDIEQVCVTLSTDQGIPEKVQHEADELLKAVRRQLLHPFFRGVGVLGYFPSSSPTLVSRRGYRELYAMFLRSRSGVRHLFEDLAQESMFIDLKDVALLYEYWVFYHTAVALLGRHAVVHEQQVVIKNGRLVQAIEVGNTDVRIAFNKTYSRRTGGSYSLMLRPDICITINKDDGDQLFILDAKYRSTRTSDLSLSSEPSGDDSAVHQSDDHPERAVAQRIVNTEDLHKMHCYMDAIRGVRAAVVIYPGSSPVFYSRDCPNGATQSFTAYRKGLSGVGAAPLSPGQDATEFRALMYAMTRSGQTHHALTPDT